MPENSTDLDGPSPRESLLVTRADGTAILFAGAAARVLRGVLQDAESYNADVAVDREGAAVRARCADALRGWMTGDTPDSEVDQAFVAMSELQVFLEEIGEEVPC
ncbi:MAG: hypothetical protein ITG02_01260 [Patulibacter sp.]|nr:hypothetical protein [Patulibacter sp.]